MALTDENMVMPVTPMNNGNNGFGGDFFGGVVFIHFNNIISHFIDKMNRAGVNI